MDHPHARLSARPLLELDAGALDDFRLHLDARANESIEFLRRPASLFVLPPGSQIGPISPAQRQTLMQTSLVAGVYEKAVDRESAYEKLKGRTLSAPASTGPAGGAASGSGTNPAQPEGKPSETTGGGVLGGLSDVLFGKTGPRGGQHDGLATNMARSAVRTMGSAVGREIIRGVLGSIFGSKRR